MSVHGHCSGQTRPLEVITISDSDDEQPTELKITAAPPATAASAVDLEVAKSVDPVSGPTSGCPSVMTVTPVAGAVRGSPGESLPGSRLPSTPRQEAGENPTPAAYPKVIVKEEHSVAGTSSSTHTPGMSQKKRLLAKAHSDWILSEPKPEPGDASNFENRTDKSRASDKNNRYSSYEYLDRQRERETATDMRFERERLDKERERDRVEREQQEEKRERERGEIR